jgi:hypothetical protein
VNYHVGPNDRVALEVYMRCSNAPCNGTLAVWGVDGTQESSGVDFTLDRQGVWYSCWLDRSNGFADGFHYYHETIRAEIYQHGPVHDVDVDAVVFGPYNAALPADPGPTGPCQLA